MNKQPKILWKNLDVHAKNPGGDWEYMGKLKTFIHEFPLALTSLQIVDGEPSVWPGISLSINDEAWYIEINWRGFMEEYKKILQEVTDV